MLQVLICTSFLYLFSSHSAHAYPEMIRHGYVNCNTCHISQNGGGLLNDYGRGLSRELMATWKSADEKTAKEHLFGYGVLSDTPIEKWLKLGGDVRTVYVYENTDKLTQARTIFMQGDFEAGVSVQKWTALATAGLQQVKPGDNLTFITRRHFLQYSLSDEINIRAGKFVPSYGINTADHVTLTRASLKLGVNYESYNLEASYQNEKYNLFVTGIFGRPDDSTLKMDQGYAVQAAYAPSEFIKFGVNGLFGKTDAYNRYLVGPFGLIGITKALMLQTETDFQFKNPVGLSSQNGVATTQKLSYELYSGVWVYGIQEYGKFDFTKDSSEAKVYGIGLQLFPRSHFEFNLAYEKAKQVALSPNYYDYAWFMAHYYL